MPLRNGSELGIHPDRGVWTQVPGGRPDGRYGGDQIEIPAYHKPLVEKAHDEPARKSARMQRAACATRMHHKNKSTPSLHNPLVLKVQAFLAAHAHREMGAALLAVGGGTVHHLKHRVRDNAQSTICAEFYRVHAQDTREACTRRYMEMMPRLMCRASSWRCRCATASCWRSAARTGTPRDPFRG